MMQQEKAEMNSTTIENSFIMMDNDAVSSGNRQKVKTDKTAARRTAARDKCNSLIARDDKAINSDNRLNGNRTKEKQQAKAEMNS